MSVLEGAVRDGAANLLWRSETFAYAAAREESGSYRGLVAGRQGDTPITSMSVIVDGAALPDPLPGTLPPGPPPGPGGFPLTPGPGPTPPAAPPVARVARFHGEAVLADPGTPIPELQKIVSEVIGPLAAQTDVRLTVRIDIEAEHRADAGFTDQTVRTVSENAKTLRFRDFGFEKE
jgi:hypothetical protein